MDEQELVQLEKAEDGKGNTVRLTYSYFQLHKKDFEQGFISIFRVLRQSNGTLKAEKVSIAWLFSLTKEAFEKEYFILPKNWREKLINTEKDPFEDRVQTFREISPEERVREVAGIRKTLEDIKKNDIHPMAKAKAIMDAVENTFLLNKASLKLKKTEVTINEKMIASETHGVVTAALGLVEEVSTTAMLFETFKSLSNGQTLNHITRVFGTMASFMYYYNKMFQHRIAQSLRLVFADNYLATYKVILPHLDEHLFVSDNLIPLPSIEPPAMKEYALGAFLHDIGKIGNLDYFESEAEYNSQEIRQHVFLSSGLILMNYGVEHEKARLMAGDHHNALFHKNGYGVTRLEREKGLRKLAEVERCIGVSADDYMSGRALGFLPTEMLAIVDIYDAMTDSSRKYKKVMSPTEALIFMTEKLSAFGMVDPVLLDIFIDFIRVQFPEVPAYMGLVSKLTQRHANR